MMRLPFEDECVLRRRACCAAAGQRATGAKSLEGGVSPCKTIDTAHRKVDF